MPIIEVMVSALVCNRAFDAKRAETELMTLENTSCLDPARLPLVILSAICLIVYTPTCMALAAVFYDTNPTLKGPSNRVHGRVDILYITLKTITIVIYKFLDEYYYIPKLITAILVW
jgi:hypothetical protein